MKETHSLKLDREPCRRLRAWEREKNVGTLRSWFSERHDEIREQIGKHDGCTLRSRAVGCWSDSPWRRLMRGSNAMRVVPRGIKVPPRRYFS